VKLKHEREIKRGIKREIKREVPAVGGVLRNGKVRLKREPPPLKKEVKKEGNDVLKNRLVALRRGRLLAMGAKLENVKQENVNRMGALKVKTQQSSLGVVKDERVKNGVKREGAVQDPAVQRGPFSLSLAKIESVSSAAEGVKVKAAKLESMEAKREKVAEAGSEIVHVPSSSSRAEPGSIITVDIDLDDDDDDDCMILSDDVQEAVSVASSYSVTGPSSMSTVATEQNIDRPSTIREEGKVNAEAGDDDSLNLNVDIRYIGQKCFKLFISDEEVKEIPGGSLQSAPSMVLKDVRDQTVHNASVTKTRDPFKGDGLEVSFSSLSPNRRYDLLVSNRFVFQLPLRNVNDFNIEETTEFCAFFYPPIAADIQHRFINGNAIKKWTAPHLIESFGVDAMHADMLINAVKQCTAAS